MVLEKCIYTEGSSLRRVLFFDCLTEFFLEKGELKEVGR